jgi:1-acyl-sn-glycerol-3-phosphate acyltransferase
MEVNVDNTTKKYTWRDEFDTSYFARAIKIIDRHGIPNLLFSDIKVSGLENVIKEDGQKLYVSNHVSLSDFIVQAYIIWKQITQDYKDFPRIVAGQNLFKWPFKNLWAKSGAIPIDRGNKSVSYLRAFNNHVLELIREGKSVLVYPDGGRAPYDDSKEFKSMLFGQVLKAQRDESADIQIVPMHIAYDNNPDLKYLRQAWTFKEKRDKLTREKRHVSAKLYDAAYFLTDEASYIHRFVEGLLDSPTRGNCYLSFGKPYTVETHLKHGKTKTDLARISKAEIERLRENHRRNYN